MKRIHYKNLQIGDRHGHWTVIENILSCTKADNRDRFVKVACVCGTVRTITIVSLTDQKNTHCGCVNRNKGKENLKYLSEYNSWRMMRLRCTNPNRHDYPRYGGRGIKVCVREAQAVPSLSLVERF